MGSCKETFDRIAEWVNPNFFFSKNYQWSNMAIVGILGDFVLSNFSGDMLEIGIGESSIYMSALAKKHNRKIYYCDSNKDKIEDIKASGHLCENGEVYDCLSDVMFAGNILTPLAFTFIDGYHEYEQAKRDFWNSEKYTIPNGYILMHDTFPPSDDPGPCNEAYKFRQEIEQDKRFDVFTFTGNLKSHKEPCYYVASTLIRKKPLNRPYYQE